jgi:hypothetical protein
MSESARLVTLGTINAGATPIQADVTNLGSDVAVAVSLSMNYTMAAPPGYPARPGFTGTATPQYPHLVSSGTTFKVLRCEATALVAAGAATLA